ncbi:MAG: DUF2397 family protein [Candidatus Electryonea clarkiae]|nr:DUF2397 family protein [Candidatus Electryonea clarkiae]
MAESSENIQLHSFGPVNQGYLHSDEINRESVTALVSQRNRAIGHLLTADRSLYYLHILFSLLRFRRAHELEPLHEDLYDNIYADQTALNDAGTYEPEQFNGDINQLKKWNLISERIELERLRGYQDTRRKKYRYSLTLETRAFLEWIEDRAHDDLEESGADTRNQLETVLSGLNELRRVLHHVGTKRGDEGDARRVLYQLDSVNEHTHVITGNLISFNERMYGFLMTDFALNDAKQILDELRIFVEEFLNQIYQRRETILGNLAGLNSSQSRKKIQLSLELMEKERKRSAHLLRQNINHAQLEAIPGRLLGFYSEDGQLDQLCRRIKKTARQVWHRLYLRLRERERKSHRLQDLRQRIKEIATMNPEDVPHKFLFELISPTQIAVDPNYWTSMEKASPPQPRLYKGRQKETPIEPLRSKKRSAESARALEQQQMEQLVQWLKEKVIRGNQENVPVTDTFFESFEDLAQTMQLIKTGKLAKGKKLANTGFSIIEGKGQDQLHAGKYSLELRPLIISRGMKHGS